MNNTADRPYTHCLNCGTELTGEYCHACGQQATSPDPSMKELFMAYLDNAYMWDQKIPRTIWTLISRPGYLTTAFTSGKIVSYLHPLKLNMFLLFVFITMFLCFSGSNKMNDSLHDITKDEMVFPKLQLDLMMTNEQQAEMLKTSPQDTVQLSAPLHLADEFPSIISKVSTIEDTNGQAIDKWVAVIPTVLIDENIVTLNDEGYYYFNSETDIKSEDLELFYIVWNKLSDIVTNYFPILVLLTVPFLSFSLRFVHRKNKLSNAHHFIFSLHYVSFLELVILLIYIAHLICSPSTTLLKWVLNIVSCLYLTIAFRQFYAIRSWIVSIIKALLTSLLYSFICMLVFAAILIIACIVVGVQMA